MKSLIRTYVFHLLSLWFATYLFSGSFSIGGGPYNFLIAALILTLLNLLVKPILKLLFFPVTALTLGLFSFIINAGIFYLFYRASSHITINPWMFPGVSTSFIHLPQTNLGFIGAVFVISLTVSAMTSFFTYLSK